MNFFQGNFEMEDLDVHISLKKLLKNQILIDFIDV